MRTFFGLIVLAALGFSSSAQADAVFMCTNQSASGFNSCSWPSQWRIVAPTAITDTTKILYCSSGSAGQRDVSTCGRWTTKPAIPTNGLVGICYGATAGGNVEACNASSGGGEGWQLKSIVFPGGGTPAPTLNFTASPGTVPSGGASTLNWSTTNATGCTASNGWTGSRGTSGSQSTGALTTTTTYSLSCTGTGGTVAGNATVTVTPAGPAPVVSLSANPQAINAGQSSTLNWNATNATACTASNGWTGSRAPSGSESTGTLNADRTYTLVCSGPGGSSTPVSTTVNVNPLPVVTLSADPTTVASGQSSTLSWSASNAATCTASGAWTGGRSNVGSESTGALTSSSTFTLTCFNSLGGSGSNSVTVNVGAGPTVMLNAIPASINSGESSTLSWSSTNATSCSASAVPTASTWTGAKATSGSQSTGTVTTSRVYTLTCTNSVGSASSSASVTVNPLPTVTLTANPTSVNSGQSSTLSWSSTNASTCTASGTWSGSRAVSGSESTGALTTSSTYTLSCSNATGGSTSASATVNVGNTPTVTLTVNPTAINSGTSATLTWTTANATSCTASAVPSASNWNGTKNAAGGSQSTGNLTASRTYTLTCTNSAGSRSASAAITVNALPTVTFTASPTTVSLGQSSTLTWSTTNAATCTASGTWSGSRATSGSESTGALSATSSYTLACSNATGGTTTRSVTVTVSTAPALTFSANPTTVAQGQSSTLTWSSTNTTSCTASNGWSGSKPLSGSQVVGPLQATTTFRLRCVNASGTAVAINVTVTVNALPSVDFDANPASVAANESSTLTWSSDGTSCTASGGWNGTKPASGSQSTGPLTATTTFTLVCTNSVGDSPAHSVTVTVGGGSPGTLSFTRRVIDSAGPTDSWMKSIGDLNGDGLPDLIVSGASGPIVWYQAPGWTKRTIASSASSESGSATADLDGDGDVDVVVGKNWYENTGNGLTWTARSLGTAPGSHDISIADVNNDGKLDVIMRGETSTPVRVFLQVSTTSWTGFSVDPTTGSNGLDVADVNNDGRRDIVVGGVWMENPGGSVQTATWPLHNFASWDPFAAVHVADVDGDGRRDIVLSISEGNGSLTWFKAPANPATGSWVANTVATNLTKVHNFEVMDLNGDGLMDIAASEYEGAGRMIVYLQGAGGSWQANVLGTDSLHNMRAADLGNDGDIDFFGATAFGVNPVIEYENTGSPPLKRVLVFSKTLGFRHDSIPVGIAAIQHMGSTNGFAVDATEDSSVFTPNNLARYRAIVFLSPSGEILNATQKAAFQQFIQAGGGWVGVHNPTALTLEGWDWYSKLLCARYVSEISTQSATLQIVNTTHVSTIGLPNPWNYTTEAYNFDVNPTVNGARVLINLDESSVSGGTMGASHPYSWYHSFDGGRMWYTTGGANSPEYSDSNFLAHLLGGIRYAAGL